MDIVIKASAIAIVSALCVLLIKKANGEISLTVAIAASAVLCLASMRMLGSILDFITGVIELTGLSMALFSPILKCVGIALIVSLTASLCRDAGQSGIASAVELTGAAAALFAALPLMTSLLETIGGLV